MLTARRKDALLLAVKISRLYRLSKGEKNARRNGGVAQIPAVAGDGVAYGRQKPVALEAADANRRRRLQIIIYARPSGGIAEERRDVAVVGVVYAPQDLADLKALDVNHHRKDRTNASGNGGIAGGKRNVVVAGDAFALGIRNSTASGASHN